MWTRLTVIYFKKEKKKKQFATKSEVYLVRFVTDCHYSSSSLRYSYTKRITIIIIIIMLCCTAASGCYHKKAAAVATQNTHRLLWDERSLWALMHNYDNLWLNRVWIRFIFCKILFFLLPFTHNRLSFFYYFFRWFFDYLGKSFVFFLFDDLIVSTKWRTSVWDEMIKLEIE